MSVNLQLQLITWLFVGLLIIIALLVVSGAFGVSTLMYRQAWVGHTNDVISQTKLTERIYKEADYIARLRLTTGRDAENLEPERMKAFQSLDALKGKMADNQEQLMRIDQLKNLIINRFAAQDDQFKGSYRNGVTISLDKTLVAQNNEVSKSIDLMFSNLVLNELDYLRLERMPRLNNWQWVIVYFTAGVMILLLAVSSSLFYLCRRILRRNMYVGGKLDEVLHNGGIADLANIRVQLEKFRDAILETDVIIDNEPLTNS